MRKKEERRQVEIRNMKKGDEEQKKSTKIEKNTME